MIRCCILAGDDPNAEAGIERLKGDFGGREGAGEVVHQVAYMYHHKAKDYEKARELYEWVVANHPADKKAIRAQMGIAKIFIETGDDPNAEAAVEKLIRDYGDDDGIAKAVDHLADECREKGDYHRAIKLYNKVASDYSESERATGAMSGAARCYIALGDDPNAQSVIEGLVNNYGSDYQLLSKALSEIAKAYEDDGLYHKAKTVRQVIMTQAEDSNNTFSLESAKNRIIIYMDEGNDVAALAEINNLVADYNDQSDLGKILFEVADKYYHVGRDYLKQAVEAKKQEDEAEESWNRAKADELFELTAEIAEKITRNIPLTDKDTLVEAYHLAAENLRRLEQFEKAADYYQRVVGLDPEYRWAGSSLYLVGYCLRHLAREIDYDKSVFEPVIKEINEDVVENYPDCSAARPARKWLKSHSD